MRSFVFWWHVARSSSVLNLQHRRRLLHAASRRAQEQAGEVLRRAQEVAVASDRLAVLAATGTGGSAARAL